MDLRKLKGIAVVDISQGTKLGTVDDVLVDTEQRRAVAMTVSGSGLVQKERQYLQFERINAVGVDAVMVESAGVLAETFGDGTTGYHTTGSLGRLRVVTDDGTRVGTVSTAHFDPESGALTEIEIGGSGALGGLFASSTIIDAASVTSIGDRIMVVPARLVDGGLETQGGC